MAITTGLTRDQVIVIEREVEKRMRKTKRAGCSCGDGARGHAPDCAQVLAEDQEWDYLFDEVRLEMEEAGKLENIDLVHKFEKAGLGIAPYKFVCVAVIPSVGLLEANPDAYNNALRSLPKVEDGMGTCAYCGMAIMNVFVIESANGTRWGVGCECIKKHGDAGLAQVVDKEKKKAAADKRRERGERARAELTTLAERADLKALPHSNSYYAGQGKTFAEEIAWFANNAGASGCVKMLKRVKARIAEIEGASE